MRKKQTHKTVFGSKTRNNNGGKMYVVFLWDVVSDKARALVLLSQRVSASVFVLVLERVSSSVGPSICAWVSARVSAWSVRLLGV